MKQNCCKSGSSLMIADPLWSCVMLLCGPLWVLCGPLRSFAVFSHTPVQTEGHTFPLQYSLWQPLLLGLHVVNK